MSLCIPKDWLKFHLRMCVYIDSVPPRGSHTQGLDAGTDHVQTVSAGANSLWGHHWLSVCTWPGHTAKRPSHQYQIHKNE